MITSNNFFNTAPDAYTSNGRSIRRSLSHEGTWIIGDSSTIKTDDKTILKMYPPDKSHREYLESNGAKV